MNALLIAALLVASIGGAALIVYAVRIGAKMRQALRDMAAAEGWQFDDVSGMGGAGTRTIIADPDEGWTVTMYVHNSSSTGSSSGTSTTRWTQFEMPGLAIEGLAVLGPDIPEKTKQMVDKMLGFLGGDLGRFFLDKMTGGLGDETQDLRSVDGPGPGTLMASPEARSALDAVRYAPELNTARAGKSDAHQPVVMRGPFGLRVRMGKYLKKPDEVRDFIALGRALADNLRG